MAFKMKYDIHNDLLPAHTLKRPKTLIKKVEFLVGHDTGNINSTARQNITYYKNTAKLSYASAHSFIDDKEILICIPCLSKAEKAYHVWYQKTKDNELFDYDSNDAAIGVELCYFNDKSRTKQAYDRYVWFLAYLMYYHKIDSVDKLTGHFILDPERRSDPVNALKTIGKTFDDLKKDVWAEYQECTQPDVPQWQRKYFNDFKQRGILSSPDYWESKLNKPITIGEIFSLLELVIKYLK